MYTRDHLIITCFTPGFDCNDSDIRLVNGSNMREGVVEICFDGVWGTVCASGLDNLAASVICRWFGFPDAGTYIPVVPVRSFYFTIKCNQMRIYHVEITC